MIHSDDTEIFCRSRKKAKKSKTRKKERKKERTKVGVSTNEVPGKMQRVRRVGVEEGAGGSPQILWKCV
jgi:hypothetical protein